MTSRSSRTVVNEAGLGVFGSRDGVIADSVISDNANNLIIPSGSRNVTIKNLSGCGRAFIYGFCGDPHAYISDDSCPNVTEYSACIFPET